MAQPADYDYELPKELISQRPLAQRADARLMVVDRRRQTISHRHVRDLPQLIAPPDCLVLNETRVVPARLVGTRAFTSGKWEGLYLSCPGPRAWRLLAKTRGKPSVGERIVLLNRFGEEDIAIRLVEHLPGGV
ncbi:MAG TPA: S-adenosylmethionine:tRNA ribosyltransferase-isomerase, partial [Pirellulales bacterium]